MNAEQLYDAIHSNVPTTVINYLEANKICKLANLLGWKTPKMQVPIYKVKLPGLKGSNGPQYLAHKYKSKEDTQIFAVGKKNKCMNENDFLFYYDQIPQEYRKFAKVYKYEEIDLLGV